MTDSDFTNLTPDQRLKQIEILLSTAAKTIRNTNERVERLEEAGLELRLQLTSLSQLVTDTIGFMRRQQAQITEQNAEIKEIQAEIRETQAECRRIWEYLLSRSGNGNSPQ